MWVSSARSSAVIIQPTRSMLGNSKKREDGDEDDVQIIREPTRIQRTKSNPGISISRNDFENSDLEIKAHHFSL